MRDKKMQEETKFGILLSDEALEKLKLPVDRKYYVYGLIDPDDVKLLIDGKVFELPFYVGKGSGDRVYDHIREACTLRSKQEKLKEELNESDVDFDKLSVELRKVESDKILKILEIFNKGKKPKIVIYRWGLSDKEAFKVEAALIDCMPNLTNIQCGHDSEYGMTTLEELKGICGLSQYNEPTDANEQKIPYMIIKLKDNITYRGCDSYEENLYKAVRGCWRADLNHAKQFRYVLAVVRGVVREVYEVDNWHTSATENPRIEFDGKPTTNPVMRKLVGKLIPECYQKRGMSYPVLYCNK